MAEMHETARGVEGTSEMHETARGVDGTSESREQHRVARLFLALLGLTLTVLGVLALLPAQVGNTTFVLGLFQADPLLGLVRLASGLGTLAMAAAPVSRAVRWYVLLVGLAYGVISIVGGIGGAVFGLFQTSEADNSLHALIAVTALGIWGLTEAWPTQRLGETV